MDSDLKVTTDLGLGDLWFELEMKGPKFLIVVSPDAKRAEAVSREIQRRFSDLGVLELEPDSFARVGQLERRVNEADAGVNFVSFLLPGRGRYEALFKSLNVHRDAVARLGRPIVFIVSSEQISELVTLAPDFWSRRSGVYHLQNDSIEELMRKLFSGPDRDCDPRWVPDPTVPNLLDAIFESEKALAKCLGSPDDFSLPHADDLLRTITDAVEKLKGFKGAKRLEVSAWLWNMAELDSHLVSMGDPTPENGRWSEETKGDANEALLAVAEELSDFLDSYLKALAKSLKDRNVARILVVYVAWAGYELGRLFGRQDAKHEAERNLSHEVALPYWIAGDPDRRDTRSDIAAQRLESWLNGVDKKPSMFSYDDERALRFLYSNGPNSRELSRFLGVSVKNARKKIDELFSKVNVFLDSSRV